MSVSYNTKVVTSGLVMYYDISNTNKSYLGAPTTNLIPLTGLSIYNNRGSDINITLTQTTETYKGAPVWKQVITPITTSGVSWLTAGNNPGIGINHGGGGGTASRYTGFSIFFKPTVNMHTTPVFTNYSNIAGWVTNNLIADMKDGWFRAACIWYDTTTRSDAKYWTINPASATLNASIVIYWAAPFKEDMNYSLAVSDYTQTSRTTSQCMIDLMKNFNFNITSCRINSLNQPDYVAASSNKITGVQSVYTGTANTIGRSWEVIVKPGVNTTAGIFGHVTGAGCTYYCNGGICINSGQYQFTWYDPSTNYVFMSSGVTATAGVVAHIVGTWNPADLKPRIYINGELKTTYGVATNLNYNGTVNEFQIGYLSASGNYYNGEIYMLKYYYNECLSDLDVKQNFSAIRGRYGL